MEESKDKIISKLPGKYFMRLFYELGVIKNCKLFVMSNLSKDIEFIRNFAS